MSVSFDSTFHYELHHVRRMFVQGMVHLYPCMCFQRALNLGASRNSENLMNHLELHQSQWRRDSSLGLPIIRVSKLLTLKTSS